MVEVTKVIAWIISFVITSYAAYFTALSLLSLLPRKKKERFQPLHKFAVVIAARNEAQVIGNLIDSLHQQRYPKELIDIIVIPNNCTDDTKQIAVSKGAKIYECTGITRSKGDVLHEYFDSILKQGDLYDGFCIFDADNVVSEEFLSEMNNAMCRGVRVGQGYRESKNPYDSVISSCYSVYYWMVNRFFNRARSALKLSALINGSGFMVSADVIRKLGGWNTNTLTEDIEFSTKCVLAGEKVQWIPDAITYDEQPLTFSQSWKQRKRWSTGQIQGFRQYFTLLLKKAVGLKSLSCFDIALFYLAPFIQILYLVSIILTVVLNLLYVKYDYFPQTDVFYRVFLSIDFSYLVSLASSVAVVVLERKNPLKLLKGIAAYWFFILSWLPINVLCIFKKDLEWAPIKHTRDVKIDELIHSHRRLSKDT